MLASGRRVLIGSDRADELEAIIEAIGVTLARRDDLWDHNTPIVRPD